MKKIMISLALFVAFNMAEAQTGTTGSTSGEAQNNTPQNKKPATKKAVKKTIQKKKDNTIRNSQGPDATDSKEKSQPKDKSGKDSNKIGDSPKFRE
jgi:hypothetical protein